MIIKLIAYLLPLTDNNMGKYEIILSWKKKGIKNHIFIFFNFVNKNNSSLVE